MTARLVPQPKVLQPEVPQLKVPQPKALSEQISELLNSGLGFASDLGIDSDGEPEEPSEITLAEMLPPRGRVNYLSD